MYLRLHKSWNHGADMLKDKDKEIYFKEARKFNKKIFASKVR